MNFLMISQSGFWLSVAGIATLLALLQILRMRYKPVTVVTNMFWQEIRVKAPARSFWQKFRHLLSYPLAFLIAFLLFLAFADWQDVDDNSNSDQHIFLLDGSASMMYGDRYSSTVDSMLMDVDTIPKNNRRVLWVGSSIKPLLVPGEETAVLHRRLRDLSPQPTPAKIEEQLIHLSKVAGSSELKVTVYGDSPVSSAVLDLLPENMTVLRAEAREEILGNRGFAEIGVSLAESGVWGQVDVYFRITGDLDHSDPIDQFDIMLDGNVADPSIIALGDGHYILRDLIAGGGLLELSLKDSDAFKIDNVTQIRLPLVKAVRVVLPTNISEGLKAYLDADPAINIVSEMPDVIIRHKGDEKYSDSDVPQLVFTPMAEQEYAFTITTDSTAGDEALQLITSSLMLDQIDANSIAQSAGQAIGLWLDEGEQRRVSLWSELLDDNFNFNKSRAFPLFMAHTIRWLSAVEPWYPYVAAGENLPLNSSSKKDQLLSENGYSSGRIGTDFRPLIAGPITKEASDLVASLQKPLGSFSSDGNNEDALPVLKSIAPDVAMQSHLMTWILLLSIALILIEWRLHQTGRMP